LIAICTGISGVGKREYLRALQTAHPKEISFFDVGDKMLEVARNLNIDTSTERILDCPESTLTALRSTVFEQILSDLKSGIQGKHVLIGLHASFHWKKVLTLGFNAHYLKTISQLASEKRIPVVYVCFTDTVIKTFARHQSREQWKGRLTLEEVLLWTNEEAMLTKMIAEYEKADFFVLPSEEPIDSLWNIIAHPNKKKLYLSFPITIIKATQPKLLEEVGSFREKLREHFVVFDPLAVKDIEWLVGDYELPARLLDGISEPLPTASEQAKAYVEAQTVCRDFQLVDQSDFVVVYYKTDRVSFGVVSEMIHGYTNNKPVYVVWSRSVSPFFAHYCTAWKPDTEPLLDLLMKKYPG